MSQQIRVNRANEPRLHSTEQGLRQQNSYLAALHETALSLMNRRALDDVLVGIVKHACALTETEHGYVYILDPVKDMLEVKVGFGIYGQYVGAYREKGRALSGVIWETGQPLAVEDYHNWDGRALVSERPNGWDTVKSAMGAPLKSGEQTVGVIGLGFSQKRSFAQADLDLLSQFAALASIALDNAKLYNQLQEELAERRRREKQLQHLSLHDPLTGLYNRTFFQEEMHRWEGHLGPSGIIICDIDGLKLINDALGHAAGDEVIVNVSRAIRESIRSSDVVARMGGDEFAVFLPHADEAAAAAVCSRIRNNVEEYTRIHSALGVSLSLGYAIQPRTGSIDELFKLADNEMYREKLYHKQSSRGALTQTLLKALEVRDFLTEGHADRLQTLVMDLGKAAGLSGQSLTDLKLLAQFHDVGKIGVPDAILFKPEPLEVDERKELRRHCEIGYRIAQSAPDLARISDWILKHHEWWNGEGYPLNLKGVEIPLECRILAIADAYDAMTNDRSYRTAMTPDAALRELRSAAGTQFDPHLVELFIGLFEPACPVQREA